MDLNPSHYDLVAMIHGLTGLLIFVCGILQFLLQKGGSMHKITGHIYNYSWIVILVTGYFIGSPIIVAIVLMGFYLSVTGVRIAILKNKPVGWIDKIILVIATVVVLFMFYSAIYLFMHGHYTFAIIATFFSFLYGFVITLDVSWNIFKKKLIGKKTNYGNQSWYVNHLMRMQFSFITAVGAFTGVQNVFGNTALNFILPAVFGFVLIRMSKNFFLRKKGIISS